MMERRRPGKDCKESSEEELLGGESDDNQDKKGNPFRHFFLPGSSSASAPQRRTSKDEEEEEELLPRALTPKVIVQNPGAIPKKSSGKTHATGKKQKNVSTKNQNYATSTPYDQGPPTNPRSNNIQSVLEDLNNESARVFNVPKEATERSPSPTRNVKGQVTFADNEQTVATPADAKATKKCHQGLPSSTPFNQEETAGAASPINSTAPRRQQGFATSTPNDPESSENVVKPIIDSLMERFDASVGFQQTETGRQKSPDRSVRPKEPRTVQAPISPIVVVKNQATGPKKTTNQPTTAQEIDKSQNLRAIFDGDVIEIEYSRLSPAGRLEMEKDVLLQNIAILNDLDLKLRNDRIRIRYAEKAKKESKPKKGLSCFGMGSRKLSTSIEEEVIELTDIMFSEESKFNTTKIAIKPLEEQFSMPKDAIQAIWHSIKKPDRLNCVAANLQQNASKIYKNTLLLDSRRVRLDVPGIDQSKGFIHACFIDGYKKKKSYICNQLPIPCTAYEFWKMIWQENVRVIVQLESLDTMPEELRTRYNPDESEVSKLYKEFNLRHENTKGAKQFTLHIMSLMKYTGRESQPWQMRRLFHLQLRPREQYGDDATNRKFLIHSHLAMLIAARYFRIRTTEKMGAEWTGHYLGPPILVQCSTGAEQSSLFIIADICISMLDDVKKINIEAVAQALSRQKVLYLDDTNDELVNFIYDLLLEFAKIKGYIDVNFQISP